MEKPGLVTAPAQDSAASAAATVNDDARIDADVRTREERVLLLLNDEDVAFASAEIGNAGFTAQVCRNTAELTDELVKGTGTAVIAGEVVTADMAELFRVLDGQSKWSDLPVVVLVRPNAPAEALAAMQAFERHPKIKTTFLQRPAPALSLISAVRSSLQSRRRQYQVRDLLQKLNDEVRSRDAFLAMLGHELRNPVTSIGYVAEIFDMGGDQIGPERLKWGAGVINRQIRHLSRLLDQLLDVARVQSGKIELEMGRHDLCSLARQAVEGFEAGPRRRRLRLGLPSEPVFVCGDRIRLSQIVENLLDNAFKYTAENGSIDLCVSRAEDQAVLSVTDDGSGIKKDALPHVFKPFYQDSAGARAGAAGLGLGLAMVDNIVRLHSGTAEAHSNGLGEGAEMIVRLPLADDAPAAVSDGTDAVPPLRLLIIEDDQELANVFATLLSSLGHEAHVVHDGSGGAESAARLKPDVAFVDLGLPDIDGTEVARRVRRELGDAAPPLVALTAWPQQEADESPFDDYLLKPVGRERVEQVFKKLASRRRRGLSGANSAAG